MPQLTEARVSLIVVPGLQELDPVGEDLIDQAVGLIDASRSHGAAEVLNGRLQH
jgi:hypothetical protein